MAPSKKKRPRKAEEVKEPQDEVTILKQRITELELLVSQMNERLKRVEATVERHHGPRVFPWED